MSYCSGTVVEPGYLGGWPGRIRNWLGVGTIEPRPVEIASEYCCSPTAALVASGAIASGLCSGKSLWDLATAPYYRWLSDTP